MKKFSLAFLLTFALGGIITHGATRIVTDSNAQSEINAAANGDIIRFMPGTYPKITVVEKDLAFRHHGSVQANVFEIEANGSKLDLIDFKAAEVFANKTANRPSRLRVIRGKYGRITSHAENTVLAYSTLNYLKLFDSGTITGNDFDGDTQFFSQVPVGGGIGIDINATSAKVLINNNQIHDYKLNSHSVIYDQCIGIRISGSPKVDILNNTILNCFDSVASGSEYNVGMGVYILSSLDVRILGNIIQNCYVNGGATGNGIGHAAILAPLGVVAQNNLYHKTSSLSTTRVAGGVVRSGSIIAEPKFTDLANGDFTLASDSPAINAGPPDAQYNDLDGTRNDIGMFGGHNFIPDGRTTDKPIVIGLDVAPIAVPTGGTVTIESTGATVK
jgi:hypothetical protein